MSRSTWPRAIRSVALVVQCFICLPAFGSYAIYVGKNLTKDGSVLIGGSGDEVSSHWLEVVPGGAHPEDATIAVGVTAEAEFPGRMIEIPQARQTYRSLTMNYSDYRGFPAPLTNGGLNEHNVAARDVWSPSRAELVAMTPNPQSGPQYSDLSRIAMQRARTAREAVEIIGALIDTYGYSTYGGNSHMFADENEGWVLIEFAGGKGLWIAERLGPDEVRMSYPGYIGEIPLDFHSRDDFMGSKNFISFAVEQGWYDPAGGKPFDVNAVYSVGKEKQPRSAMEQELRDAAPINLRRMMDAVRDPRISKDTTGYGQVVQLRDRGRPEMNLLWVAPTGSVTAPFIPYRIGVQRIAPQFGKHRYLTKGEASAFLTRDWQIQEATEFAGRLFKRLMYYTCDHPQRFLPEVQEALTAFENRLIAEQDAVAATSEALFAAGQRELALEYLTGYSERAGQDALELGHALLGSIEARTELLYGLRRPEGETMSGMGTPVVSCGRPVQEARATASVDATALAALDAEIAAGTHGNIDGLLVIRHGHVVFERRYARDYVAQNPEPARASHPYNYYDPKWHPWYHGNTDLHTMQSVSKSVLAVLFGVAQQQGLLPGLDTPALALLKKRRIADPDGRKAAITLRDLLTMRSGIAWDEETVPYTDPRNDCAAMEASGDWVQFVLDKPMAASPGSTWVYNSGVTMLLAEILEEVTGRGLADFSEAELFKPLGIEAHYWKLTPTGLPDAEGGLYLAPRDIARIAKLYLDHGQVGGQQLVPREWVRESLAPATPSTYPENTVWRGAGYGFQWWVYGDYLGQTAWGGSGYGGQFPIVVPGLDLIVVVTSWNIYGPATDPLTLVRERILPAMH